jgi:hypothetical protein
VLRNDANTATLTLAYSGSDFDSTRTLNVTVQQSGLDTGVGPATTGTVAVGAIVEADANGAGEGIEGQGNAWGHHKVQVCHHDKTKWVPPPALEAHLNHGDSEGACA